MTEQPSRPYATPAALRQALTNRLAAAAVEGPWPLADLQRQFAYDRLLHRLYLLDSGWILKGATALLARQISARHTIDLDIYRAATRAEAERDLRTAVAIDARDWFEFEIGAGRRLAAEGAAGTRLPATARIGNTVWASFHIDLVGETIGMTGTPDNVPPLTPVTLPGLERKPSFHQRFPQEGWSIYGAQRAQPAATGGKWDSRENRLNKPIGNRWQPTATVPERMVRRGSTVRVRQRA